MSTPPLHPDRPAFELPAVEALDRLDQAELLDTITDLGVPGREPEGRPQ